MLCDRKDCDRYTKGSVTGVVDVGGAVVLLRRRQMTTHRLMRALSERNVAVVVVAAGLLLHVIAVILCLDGNQRGCIILVLNLLLQLFG